MVKFVRLLACAELVAGCVWLYPAIYPRRLTIDDVVEHMRTGDKTLKAPDPVSPYPGIGLIGTGTIALAVIAGSQAREVRAG